MIRLASRPPGGFLLAVTMLVLPAAAPATDDADTVELERITVVAHKLPRPVRDVAAVVSVFDRRDLDDLVVEDIADIVRYEPQVSVDRDASRFGLSGFRIRGVGGNRVAVELDGVPIPDGFAIGDFSNAGRNVVDPEMVGRVEILRGPASSLYGSDALGGVVSFTTTDPADYLGPDGDTLGFALRGGLSTDDDSRVLAAAGAWRAGALDAMVIGSLRDGHERDARGARANPADYRDQNALAKFVHYDAGGRPTRFVLESTDAHRETDVLSLVRAPGRFVNTTALAGDDRHGRDRVSLERELGEMGALAERGVARLFWQGADTDEHSIEERVADARTPYPTRRARDFHYRQTVTGGEITLERSENLLGLEHRFVYGLELLRTSTTERRAGLLTNLDDGTTTNAILGEVFPLRDFPDSTTRESGAYLQDEIRLGDDWTLIPGVRLEYYELDPEPDPVYLEDNPGAPATGLTEFSAAPKLALIRHLGRDDSLFAQYARGFRAPPFEDVNIGLDIPLFHIRALPNPDLKAETSDGLELGYRHDDGSNRFEGDVFYTRFRNLIESKVPLGVDPETGYLLFQSVNRERARIYGAEFKGRFALPALSGGDGDWTLHLAAGLTRGQDTVNDRPLNGIQPASAVAGLEYRSARDDWGMELMTTLSAPKTRVDESSGELFKPAGYATLDLLGHWRPTGAVQVNWGIFNLSDRRYWLWSDVQGLPVGDPVVPMSAQPGRHASVSIRVSF